MSMRGRSGVMFSRIAAVIAVAVIAMIVAGGCRSAGKTQSTEKTVYKAESTPGEEAKVIKETTIIKEKESHGLVGTLFYKLGDIVALPFNIIGMTFDAIF
jgi:hypothetical protein